MCSGCALWIGMARSPRAVTLFFKKCFISRFFLRFSWLNLCVSVGFSWFILRFELIFVLVGRQGGPANSSTAAGDSTGKFFSSPWQPQLPPGAGGSGCREGGASGTPPKA